MHAPRHRARLGNSLYIKGLAVLWQGEAGNSCCKRPDRPAALTEKCHAPAPAAGAPSAGPAPASLGPHNDFGQDAGRVIHWLRILHGSGAGN
jgi:hypothetical protein